MDVTKAPLVQLRDPQHFRNMKEVDYGSRLVVIFINNKISLSAATTFKTLCTEYMIELSERNNEKVFQFKILVRQ